jgi:hypothetical protein
VRQGAQQRTWSSAAATHQRVINHLEPNIRRLESHAQDDGAVHYAPAAHSRNRDVEAVRFKATVTCSSVTVMVPLWSVNSRWKHSGWARSSGAG